MGKKKKIRLRTELKHGRTSFLHDEGLEAYNGIGKILKDGYARPKWTGVNIALMFTYKAIKERGLKPGDDIEAALGI